MKIFNFENRKAVSTIIGTFFFVIIMAGAFTAFIIMMQTNSNFLNTQLDATQNEIQKIQGQFTIAAAYDNSGTSKRLCVSVKNAGSTPLEIADLFIVNKTNNEARQFDIDFRDAFVPVSSIRQILDNQPITLRPGIHDIKVVSTSGVMQTTELKVFATSSPDPRFNVTAFVYPINSASGQNVTVGMHVHNRMNTTLINVQANGDPLVEPSGSVSEGFIPSGIRNYTRLDPNEDALFLWEPEFVGGVGSKLSFNVRAKAFVEGCTSSSFSSSSYIFNNDTVQLKVVPGVKKQILASPETFISIPSPFGASTGNGLFGIVVQNPTDKPFTVSQVALQIVSASGDSMLKGTTTAPEIVGVAPTGTSGWKQYTNVITWKGNTRINAYDMTEFVVTAEPNPSTSIPINTIFFNVYSSYGQFGKGPLTFGVNATSTAIVNVFAQRSFTTAAQGGSPVFTYPDVASGSTQTFHFTIANNGSASVSSGAASRPYLLINIPPGLRDITDVSDTPGTTGLSTGLAVHSLIEFADGSSQKPIEVTSDLTAPSARTYSMTATMPTISVPAHYIITLTANGTASTTASRGAMLLGPVAEIDIQVCPTSGTTMCQ